MTRKLVTRLLAVSLAIGVLFTGCSNGSGTSAASGSASAPTAGATKSDTFTYAIPGDPGNSVNVMTTGDRYGLMTVKMLYSPLYIVNPDGIEYDLAESMTPSADHLTYTAKLRKNVKWSDGQPLTADDVVYTFNEMEKESNAGWAYGQLMFGDKMVEVTKVDDYTVQFKLPIVSSSAVEMFSQIFIMPKHIYEGSTNFENNPKNATPVGSGPYKLAEYKAGQYVKFVANDDYFLGKPKIKNIIFRIVENANTAKIALQKGEVDAALVQPSDVKDLKNDTNLTLKPYSEGRVGYMMVNTNTDNMKNKKIRQAVFFALNRDQMNKTAFLTNDYYANVYTFLPPSNPWASTTAEKYEQNVNKSKQLLQEAGVSNISLKLGYSGNDAVQQKQAVLIQQQLAAVGIKLELSGADSTALSNEMKKKGTTKYDLYLNGYIMGIDPDTYSSLFISGSPSNYSGLKDAKIDELFSKGKIETNDDKRKTIYADLQKQLQDDAVIYPICDNKKILAIKSNIAGIDEAKLVSVYSFGDMSKLYYK